MTLPLAQAVGEEAEKHVTDTSSNMIRTCFAQASQDWVIMTLPGEAKSWPPPYRCEVKVGITVPGPPDPLLQAKVQWRRSSEDGLEGSFNRHEDGLLGQPHSEHSTLKAGCSFLLSTFQQVW